MRLPFVIAWGLSIGFTVARENLISTQGRVSFATGSILVVAGALPPLVLFAIHRSWTGATIRRRPSSICVATPESHQLSLRMLMVIMTAFAITAVIARTAITAPPDPYGNEHDVLVLHAWLAFFPCLASAPALLVVFRPSWKIVLAGCFIVALAFVEPLTFALFAGLIFESNNLAATFVEIRNWADARQLFLQSLWWHGQTVVATVVYALLARAAGFRMVCPDQSNDKNPNPSGQPATDAGCVQD